MLNRILYAKQARAKLELSILCLVARKSFGAWVHQLNGYARATHAGFGSSHELGIKSSAVESKTNAVLS